MWEILVSRGERDPERRAFIFLGDGEEEAARMTYGELDRRARALAVALRKRAGPGDRAILLLPAGLEFVVAFLGCFYAGIVAVPAYPPRPPRPSRRRDRDGGRIRAILEDCRPRLALVSSATASRVSGSLRSALSEAAPGLDPEPLIVDRTPLSSARRWAPPTAGPDDVAFLQYTSGSTASPRGVEVTHRNLLANERAIAEAFDQSEESVVVGWLPMYHDMGLIGNVLQPIWSGGSCVLMSPASFLQRPRRWLEAVDRYRATTSGGPDFAYGLTVRRVPPEDRGGLDLSCWRVAYNGAEPVRQATLEQFAEAFAGCGFRREALLPCYGLAEATLFVSGGGVTEAPSVRSVAARALEAGRAEEPEASEPAGAELAERPRPLVGCGRAARGVELRVVHADRGVPRPAGAVGEIWVAGESVARGYFRRPEETAETFGARLEGDPPGAGRWLRTGDLGFRSEDGELFVTGRSKDLIIVRGRNLYPQDLERTAEESHEAVRGAAAFPVDARDEELPAVLFEVEPRRRGDAGVAAAAVRDAVTEEHQVSLAGVVALGAGALPRTSSGKVRRGECRRRFLAGELRPLAELAGRSPVPAADGVEGGAAADLLAAVAGDRDDILRTAEEYLATLASRVGVRPVGESAQRGPDR
ncbi:MAG: fatty acyl-AMP ligase, partial [Acidobacteriota bacterium]